MAIPAGWFAEVLPFFKAIETDVDFHDEWHGATGPLPIGRDNPADLTELQAAFFESAIQSGHVAVGDHNAPGAVGVGPTPRNWQNGTRMSTVLTYLERARGNY